MKSTIGLILLLLSSLVQAGESKIYNVKGSDYEGYWAKVSDNAPLVLLIHDWDGLTDYEMKRAQMLNEMGYNVFAADLFGKGVRPTEVKDKKQHTGELYKDREKLRALMQGSLDFAASLGGNTENVVVMGYCFGGAAVLESARAGMNAKGFVTFHGGLSTPDGQSYSQTTAPILVLHGTADSAIPMSQFASLAEQLETAKVKHEMITYSGAPHAFTVFGSPRYREDADRKSWASFSNFLTATTQ
ncbi:dienelactone hydrolase family protein [Vibrio europaeus]|uniref:Dienelactone hydrolase n=1 Tax=Vibrio europaeus TaxID=300876 RepID=A0A178J4P7_9VIBR|nr:dienelactone hydrolase family protein [Vibrio europaeus]MDC5706188.1 dienelactone hydrolase family protein [Vibrio europaeus]MDC5709598.1 dienelactone hydrolase family protein [Vibrio europaeus]MDC5713997.1 dienelactone hydrolase family protein [Vibrio europaeus]MDC5720736.1 dienelactone hydrolase family protein [Vibrio europaeus]MDC5723394.1 dienelactone hydrolase family protein [Vibrio europaeus]